MNNRPGNAHLIISVLLVSVVALAYGIAPNWILPRMLDIRVESVDLLHIFRAMMGLYLGNIALWIIGIRYPSWWRTATLGNILFMGGLAFGRIVSLLLDGPPSTLFIGGLLVELALGSWGILNIKQTTP